MDESRGTQGSARQRQQARQKRRNRQPMAVHKTSVEAGQTTSVEWVDILVSFLNVIRKYPNALKIAGISIAMIALLLLFSMFFGGRVPLNVFVLNTSIGGLPFDDAVAKLETNWSQGIQIPLRADNQEWIATPVDLGLRLNAQASIEATEGIGLSGIPFGYRVDPVISIDEVRMRQFLQELSQDIYIAPVNAQYRWQDNVVSGVPGQEGVQLDVEASLRQISQSPLDVLEGEITLVTTVLSPLTSDPDDYLDATRQFVSAPFELTVYDPFADRYLSFTASPETLSTWIEAGESSLVARNDPVFNYIDTLNNSVQSGLPADGYLNAQEVINAINLSLSTGSTSAQVLVRFNSTTYEVVAGDTGYRISRKTGIPFFLIEEANPERDLGVLSPGDIINLPSRDVTLPLPVVANKRIIVNLETQSLLAYENGQEVFNWQISSGISEAPTSPGIYQILSHEPVAYGSSYSLCNDTGCGQWELNWFMGIYEVVPGLVNGFHGAVLLPNGSYLGGNNVGTPYTLGCVMSRDDQAKQLYDWADDGTIVEIISRDYPPQSELARRAFNL